MALVQLSVVQTSFASFMAVSQKPSVRRPTELVNPDRICCDAMGRQLRHECEQHPNLRDCPDVVVVYYPHVDEFGMPIRDGGASSLGMQFCPWCGKKLPDSKRDLWCDTLNSMGYDSPISDDIPAEYRTDAWWRDPDVPVA